MCRILIALFLLGDAVTTSQADAAMFQNRSELRERSQKLYSDNQFAEALAGFQQLAVDPENSDPQLPEDFAQCVNCFQQLGRVNEFDGFLENVLAAHTGNWRMLVRVAQTLNGGIDSGGFLIGGQFERGGHRGGGTWASCAARDRVHALQLLLKAVPLAEKDDNASGREKSDVYRMLADSIGMPRHSEAWKLQDLTDLTALPDYDSDSPGPYGRGRRGRG